MSRIGIERLRELADAVVPAIDPDYLNMWNFCGPVCCIGGHAAKYAKFREQGLMQSLGNIYYAHLKGYIALEAFFQISQEQCEFLFDPKSYNYERRPSKDMILRRINLVIDAIQLSAEDKE